jgi:hypothetical protein
MGCQICKNLERAYDAVLGEFNEARSSAGYQVTRRFAAEKKVEMERARYELEEHRARCVFASIVSALSQEPASSKRQAA